MARRLGWLLCLIAAIAVGQTFNEQSGLAGYARRHKLVATDRERPTILRGSRAPGLAVKQWLNGSPSSGTTRLIDFWSVNCGPCVKSLPDLADVQKRYRDSRLQVIGIHPEKAFVREKGLAGFDVNVENRAESVVPAFLAKRGLTMIVGIDRDGTTARAYAIDAVPTYFLVNRRGIVIYESHHLPSDADIQRALN